MLRSIRFHLPIFLPQTFLRQLLRHLRIDLHFLNWLYLFLYRLNWLYLFLDWLSWLYLFLDRLDWQLGLNFGRLFFHNFRFRFKSQTLHNDVFLKYFYFLLWSDFSFIFEWNCRQSRLAFFCIWFWFWFRLQFLLHLNFVRDRGWQPWGNNRNLFCHGQTIGFDLLGQGILVENAGHMVECDVRRALVVNRGEFVLCADCKQVTWVDCLLFNQICHFSAAANPWSATLANLENHKAICYLLSSRKHHPRKLKMRLTVWLHSLSHWRG